MPAKLTETEYKARLEAIKKVPVSGRYRNLRLVGKYINTSTGVEHTCLDCGYHWITTPNTITSGRGCPECAKNSRIEKSIKWTTETYSTFLKKKSLELIGTYVNHKTKCLHKCLSCSHEWMVLPYSITTRDSNCPKCAVTLRKTKDQNFWNQEGYINLLREINTIESKGIYRNIKLVGSFVNQHTNTKHKCLDCGNVFITRPSYIVRGSGCPACAAKESGSLSKDEYVKILSKLNRKADSYSKHDNRHYVTWRLVGKYINNTTHNKHECTKCGFVKNIRPSKVYDEHSKCSKCYADYKKAKVTNHVYKALQKSGIDLISDIKTTSDKAKYQCQTCNHVWKANLNGPLYQGTSCPACSAKILVSKPHKLLCDFLDSLGIKYKNNKRILDNKEIDIWIPKYRLGIEIDGVYWHSEVYKDKNYHAEKQGLAQDYNINLLQFWDSDINDPRKFPIICSMIQHRLNMSKRKYARKLEVVELDHAKAKKFFNENHFQGNVGSALILGLCDNVTGRLYAAMSFGKPRFNANYKWELLRFAVKRGYAVVGGASKLFSYFRKYHKSPVISYADKRYSDGGLYSTLGFKYIHQSNPNYFWIKGALRLSRYQTQKHKLKDLLEHFSSKKSETANMHSNGFIKVYDSGTYTYVMGITP